MLSSVAFGPNQFAYTPERGARDALALMALVWITTLAKRRKVGIYCSDVAGAFDRVNLDRLAAKLRAKQIHKEVVDVIISWLRKRRAQVVVGGDASKEFELKDMVFQGTVWGPTLWIIFDEDARMAIQELLYNEIVYTDDLNAYREFPGMAPNVKIKKSLGLCQKELHNWGKANQVVFDPKKESFHILAKSKAESVGGDFKLLGVFFDVCMEMANAVNKVVREAGWKLKMLLRTRRFYTDAELIVLYKAHLLSYLEYRTPAVYHATRDVLDKLDRVQSRFLRDAGVDDGSALVHFNLAPLASRRDMAMLGVLHRTVLGKGPPHFKDHFKVETGRRLKDPRRVMNDPLVKRSALGLAAIYNMLPGSCREKSSVKDFQRELQKIMRERLADGCEDWACTFCPRVPLGRHPLK